MKIRVKLLGYLRLELGRKEMDVDAPPGASIAEALARLLGQVGPEAERALVTPGRGYNVVFTLNGRVADVTTLLSEGDELTLFPPSAGGAR
ncbi:MAG: MoaD/ThiS family protein [Chloroflexota bacterium]